MKFIENCLICRTKLSCLGCGFYYCGYGKLKRILNENPHIFSILKKNSNEIDYMFVSPKQWAELDDYGQYSWNMKYMANFGSGKSKIIIQNGSFNGKKILIPKLLTMDFPKLENFLEKINVYLLFI